MAGRCTSVARHTIATAAAATGSSDLAAAEAAALCVCVLATSSSGSSTAAAAAALQQQRVREDWSQQCDSFRGTTPRVTHAAAAAGDTPPRPSLQLITHLVPWPVMRPGGVSGARNTPDTPTTAPCKLDTDTDPPSATGGTDRCEHHAWPPPRRRQLRKQAAGTARAEKVADICNAGCRRGACVGAGSGGVCGADGGV